MASFGLASVAPAHKRDGCREKSKTLAPESSRKLSDIGGLQVDIGGMQERPNRLGQGVPPAAQKRSEETNQAEYFDQRRENYVKECISSARAQSDLVA
jgi:hypothetical protein